MKKIILFLTTFLSTCYAFAQLGFEEQNIIDDTNFMYYTSSIFLADLDGDGDDDLIAGTGTIIFEPGIDHDVSWFENLDGLGNFGDQKPLPLNENVFVVKKVIAADLDNDGDLDIVAIGTEGFPSEVGILLWYPNLDGQGNFGEQQIISTFNEDPVFIAAEDMDDDGSIDLVVALEQTKIVWFKNTFGLGVFSDEILISDQANFVRTISVADLDGDGDKDVLSASALDDEVYWYEKINNSTFFGPKQIIADFENVTFVLAIDLDNDNDQDIIYSSSFLGKIVWRKNLDGLGAFSDEIVISEAIDSITQITAADIDNDNDFDLIVSSTNRENVILLKNEITGGEANFTEPTTILTNNSGFRVKETALSDINNDGSKDIFTHAYYIDWYSNNIENENFTFQNYITYNVNFPRDILGADLDNDGDLDLVTKNTKHIVWLEKIDGEEEYFPHYIFVGGPFHTSSLDLGDIDNDGDIDLIIRTAAADEPLLWFENTDNATDFISHFISDAESIGNSILSDMDNDGDLDVVARVLNGIYWFENLDGLGNYSLPIFIVDGMYPSEIADIDNDNDLDIIAGEIGDSLYWLENINNGDSFASTLIDTGFAVVSTNPLDMDEDGDIDLIIGGEDASFNDSIILFENVNGEGLFNAGTIIGDNLSGLSQVLGIDLDLDGDKDIVSLTTFDDLGWYENTGDNNYEDRMTIANDALSAKNVLAIDIDQDTDSDFIVTYSNFAYESKITLYKNLGLLSVSNENLDFFSVHPNPVNSTLTINASSEIMEINIYDHLGKKVLTKKQSNQISLASLASGIYYINILDSNGYSETEKVIKQ